MAGTCAGLHKKNNILKMVRTNLATKKFYKIGFNFKEENFFLLVSFIK